MKARYLMFYSYLGTHFRRSEKQWTKGGGIAVKDPESIQGAIEEGLSKLKPVNFPALFLSSRTDRGVHALQASAHVDLERPGASFYDADYVQFKLNRHFGLCNLPILIKQVYRVRNDFEARFHATSRTYKYRLAVSKKGAIKENEPLYPYIPIEEWGRCYFIRGDRLDIEAFREAGAQFVGYHDFTSFRTTDKRQDPSKHARREILSLTVERGTSLALPSQHRGSTELFDFWDINIHGRGFVHKQIRRMLGVMRLAGSGALAGGAGAVRLMLQVPSKHSWPSHASSFAPYGLYLAAVRYDERRLRQAICDTCPTCDTCSTCPTLPTSTGERCTEVNAICNSIKPYCESLQGNIESGQSGSENFENVNISESIKATSESIKDTCDSVKATSEFVKASIESVKATSETVKATCESVKDTCESVKATCDSIKGMKVHTTTKG